MTDDRDPNAPQATTRRKLATLLVFMAAASQCGCGREFFREWDWSCDCNFSPNGDLTQAENVVRGLENRGVVEPINYESAIAVSRYDKGQLQEVRVFPMWGRHDGPLSRRGIPMTAPPEIAQRILQRLQKLSATLGTRIEIEGNVGVIRLNGQRSSNGQ